MPSSVPSTSTKLRDRTGEGQHYRVAGLNLLAAIIIYWNTLKLGDAVFARRQAGLELPGELLTHVLAARLGAHQPDRGIPLAGRRPSGTA